MAATVVKELAMAAMAPSPGPSSPFASTHLKRAPSSSHSLCLRGSQPNLWLGREFQSGSQLNPCFSRVLQHGPQPKACFSRELQSGLQPNPCFPRVLQNGSRPKQCVGTDLQSGSRLGSLSRISCRASSSSQATQHELPEKLQEIVRVFQGVAEPRAKCEQLLRYASKLKPLAEDQKQPENKVEGCVSKVYIVCEFNKEDGRVYFEAESDVLLTKGLAGLLVEGLSGVTVEEVLKVTPDFVHMLGLKQSLTPSRSNGFLNMLKLIQKKTFQVYSNSTPMIIAGNATVPITSIDPQDGLSDHTPSPGAPQTKKHLIEKKLTEGLTPLQLEVQDVSHQHAGHAGVPRGSSETHFHVKIVSQQFQGRSLLKRHRLVHDLLQADLPEGGVHALSLSTKTPSEVAPKA